MLTANWILNLLTASGYIAVAIVVQIIHFPLRHWRTAAVLISLFFLGCSATHIDLAYHAYTHTFITLADMSSFLHQLHTIVQALTVWPATIGLIILARWVSSLLARIAELSTAINTTNMQRERRIQT